jgi:peptidoglycan hydrolase CwlO-like protein
MWSLLVFAPTVSAQSQEEIDEINKKINEIRSKLEGIRQEKNTLASTIQYLDNKILLNEQEITKSQYEIRILQAQVNDLGQRVEGLQTSLSELSEVLIDRVQTQYKRRATDPIHRIFASAGVTDLLKEHKYYEQVRAHTQDLLVTTEYKRQVYDQEKTSKEQKQVQVESLEKRLQGQLKDLEEQKDAKKKLLSETNNSEKEYQKRLSEAQSELEAINAIVAGKGKETKIRDVNQGDQIASVISGKSCNSGGTHLHFIVSKGGNVQNPFGYLKGIDHENCSGSSCGSSNGDSFNPSGSWEWPISGPIRMMQGYGSTWAARNTWVGRIYSFHNGLDIVGSSDTVKAVQAGTLYRGAYSGSNGCALPYVRVAHKDSDIETLYLHVNY